MHSLWGNTRQGYLELLAYAEKNGLRRIAFSTTNAQVSTSVDHMIIHTMHMLHPVEFTLFDMGDTMPILANLGGRFTFDDLRVSDTIPDSIQVARSILVYAMQKRKYSKCHKNNGAADAEVGIDWPWKIQLCRLICDGVAKE